MRSISIVWVGTFEEVGSDCQTDDRVTFTACTLDAIHLQIIEYVDCQNQKGRVLLDNHIEAIC